MFRLLSFSIIFWSLQSFAGVKWIANPINFPDVKANEMLTFDLSEYVEGGEYLNFSVMGAPAFLSVGSAGILAGTPSNADVGIHCFRAMVQSGDQGDITEACINVKENGPTPQLLTCRDGSNAYYVGATPDKKLEVFTCPR